MVVARLDVLQDLDVDGDRLLGVRSLAEEDELAFGREWHS